MSLVKPKKGIGFEIRWMRQGKRQTIYLKGAKRPVAEKFDRKIKELLDCERHAVELPASLVGWLQSLDEPIHARLVHLGLVEGRVERLPIPCLLEAQAAYLSDYDVREKTFKQTKSCFKIFSDFMQKRGNPNPLVTAISPADIRAFRANQKKRKYAESTVRKRCSRNKQLFTQLIEDKIIDSNPFDAVQTTSIENEENREYIEAETVLKMIDELEMPEFKIMLAMCRFGGLRRHEVALMRWKDIDFESNAMTVRSNKTPPIRTCPLFSELRPLLEPHRGECSKKIQAKWDCDSNAPAELLKKACKKKGLPIWTKPYQNLRASRVTELLDRYQPIDVCKWLGNSPAIAMKHYAMAQDKNFQDAVNFIELEEKKNG